MLTESPCPILRKIKRSSAAGSSAQRRHASAQWVRAGHCACEVRERHDAALGCATVKAHMKEAAN